MKNKGLITFISFLLVAIFLFYYIFIDTLTISQVVGPTNDPRADIFINLFDFDSGLTRWDLYNLASKSDYWNARMQQVRSIQDPRLRELENEKLMAEMMRDPSMKKIARKLLGFGGKSAFAILQATQGFKLLGLF